MSYISDKIDRDSQHRYKTPIGELLSVTTYINVIDAGKSGALVGWAIRETCDFIESQIPDVAEGVLMGTPTIRDIVSRARKEAAKQRDEAGNIGKVVHGLVERWGKARINGEAFTVPMELMEDGRVMSAWDAFNVFAATRGFRPLVSEKMVYSKKYRFAGTLDLIAQGKYPRMRKAKTYLIDIKTGTVIEKTVGPQLAAYAEAYEEMTGDTTIDGIAVLQLNRETGEHNWLDMTKNRGKHWKVFRAAMNLFNAINRHGGGRK